MLLKNAEVFCGGEFIKSDVLIDDACGKITETAPLITEKCGNVIDCSGELLLPGLVDIHTHGCMGWDFSDLSPDIKAMTDFYLRNGVTSVCAATMTMPVCDCRTVMSGLAHADGVIAGIYMEGPFLGAAKKGAHDERFLLPPDIALFDELDRLSYNRIKVVAVDPCYESTPEFTKTFSRPPYNKIVSAAHTDCDYVTAADAFDDGVKLVTHLFNAMNPLLHREPGLIGAFIDNRQNGVFAEIICDGTHVAAPVIRLMFDLCGDSVILISDSMRAAGLDDGEYTLGGIPVSVKNSVARQMDGTIAGSTATLLDCVRNAINFGVPIAKAINSATVIPARLIGLSGKGEIRAGFDADIITLGRDLGLRRVFVGGKVFL